MFGYMVDPVVSKPSPGLVTLQQLVALSYRVGIYWGPEKFGALNLWGIFDCKNMPLA